ncbi:MAG TPA: DNA polymerase III subunit beta [Verrucomicrobia bacterium]|nr:DNA polymerase III subunit beta [Verrucomicrobiota bacterium]HCG20355.1 DNA polymerase III subunit beta [Verrucomicrobiota bacterium]
MKFTLTRTQFLDGLKAVLNIVPNRSTTPILQNVLLEAAGDKLKMRTTSIDITVCSEVDCTVQEPGATTLPVKLLFNSVAKAVEGLVEVTVDENESAKIVAGSATYMLPGMPAKDYPPLPETADPLSYTLPLATMKEILRKTSYAASTDETRRAISGVLLRFKDQKLTAVATDGRRMAMVEYEVEFPAGSESECILPNRAVQELQRTPASEGDVVIEIKGTQICFTFGKLQLYAKLIDETYPNFYQVIPQELKERIVVDRQQLLDVLDRVNIMSTDTVHSTRFIFESDLLTVTSAAGETTSARDEVPIKYKGEKIEIMLNPVYVMEPLRAIDDDEVAIELKDGQSPALIKCSIPFLYVLMPLRVH